MVATVVLDTTGIGEAFEGRGLDPVFPIKISNRKMNGVADIVIFLIIAFDRPFRGELGLRPDSYQLVYDQLMKP